MHPLIIVGGAGVLLYVALSKPSSKVQKGLKNSGIGGAAKRTGSGAGVSAFPVGSIADSFAKIGTSLFGGSGTHNPVDPSIRPPSAGGLGGIVTNESQLGLGSSNIPAPGTIVTRLDEAQPATYAELPPTDASVGPEDFMVDSYD